MSKSSLVAIRQATGAGIADIQRALEEAGGDEAKALEVLRRRGQAKAEKQLGRATNEGLVHAYVHGDGRVGVLVEVGSETDFVARGDDFKNFVHDVALQIAATAPTFVSLDAVPAEVVERERSIARDRLEEQGKLKGKDDAMIEKILEGSLGKFYEDAVLLNQHAIKDETRTIGELLTELSAKVGENITIKRFVRYVLGE